MSNASTNLPKDERPSDEGTASGGGNTDAVASNAAPRPNATTNSAQGNGAQSAMELSLPAQESLETERKPERDFQKEGSQELLRILGVFDAEADAAVRSAMAGGHMLAEEAALKSIVNTDAQNFSMNAELQSKVMDAARAARVAIGGSMQDFKLAGGANFSDEQRSTTAKSQTLDGPVPTF